MFPSQLPTAMVSRVSSDDCERCFTAEDSVISEKHRENKVCPSKSDINPAGCLAASSTAKQTGDHQPLNLDWSILTNPRLLRRPVKLSPPASSRNCLIGVGWMVDGRWKGRWDGVGFCRTQPYRTMLAWWRRREGPLQIRLQQMACFLRPRVD